MNTKYNRTFHFHWSPGTTKDDKITTDTSGLVGPEIVITEKLDGENNGMDNGGVYARSHSDYTTSKWTQKIRQFHELKIKNTLPEDVFLFCENLEGIHSIEYDKLTNYFYLIGVRYGLRWLSWDEVLEHSFLFDIPTVPVLFRGRVSTEKQLRELTETLSKEKSVYGNEREGVVVRTVDGFDDSQFFRSVLKWVREDHVKTDTHWSKNVKFSKLKP